MSARLSCVGLRVLLACILSPHTFRILVGSCVVWHCDVSWVNRQLKDKVEELVEARRAHRAVALSPAAKGAPVEP